jgi:predicted alpha/beta superfamily hydrolase
MFVAGCDAGGANGGGGGDGGGGGADLGAAPDLAGAPDLAPWGGAAIRIHYPAGSHTIALRGDAAPLDWSHGVTLTGDATASTFTYTFADLPSRAEFKPLLDDATWSRGPNYVVTRGATVDVYPRFNTAAGRVTKLFPAFHSALLGNDRVVWAYLPASYDENTLATYPVLYMHDGQNLFDPNLAFGGNEWRVDETLDAAAQDGSIRELIVIAPENAGAKRIYEYTPSVDSQYPDSGGGALYLRMLVEELKPQVDATLRTRPDAASTGTLGSSLGGLISAYAGTTHADTFGLIGAMSPSTWWDNLAIVDDVKASGTPRPLRVYVDSGDTQQADDATDTAKLDAAYASLGYVEGTDLHYVVQTGAQHNEVYWAERLPGALEFLFGPRTP